MSDNSLPFPFVHFFLGCDLLFPRKKERKNKMAQAPVEEQEDEAKITCLYSFLTKSGTPVLGVVVGMVASEGSSGEVMTMSMGPLSRLGDIWYICCCGC